MRRLNLLSFVVANLLIFGCSKNSSDESSSVLNPSALNSPKEEIISEINSLIQREEKFKLGPDEVSLLQSEGIISDEEKAELLELTKN